MQIFCVINMKLFLIVFLIINTIHTILYNNKEVKKTVSVK